MSSSSSELIDDADPRVQYQAGWTLEQNVVEVGGTRHGAKTAGLKAWLSFTGTGVHVVGTLSATYMYGLPTTTYLVDGEVASTYTAPLLPSDETLYNVTFFSALNLAPGNHTVTIENMNGTSPNMFWFDYFLVDSPSELPADAVVNPGPKLSTTTEFLSPLASVSSSAKSVTPVSETNTTVAGITISVSVKSTAPVSETSTIGASVTISAADASQTSTTNTSNVFNPGRLPPAQRSNSGAIVGGAVAGGALLAFLALAFFCLRCKRPLHTGKAGAVAPFTSSRDPFITPPSSPRSSSMRYSIGSTAMLSTQAVVGLASHRQASPPPRELEVVPRETVGSDSEFDIPHPSAGPELLGPLGPITSSSIPITQPPRPISEKHSWLPLPSLRVLPRSSPPTGTAGTGQASTLLTSSSAPGTAETPTPSTELPPGVWHAPPDSHGPAYSLLRSLFSQGSRAATLSSSDSPTASRAADSGLRLYGDPVVLPPAYTQD